MREWIGGCRDELDTPCLVVDLDRLERNLDIAREAARVSGKQLRPHAKTHKCGTIARMQIERGAIGVCAAKVSEAEALVNGGIRNVLVTGPVADRGKVSRLLDIREIDPGLLAVIDSGEGAELAGAEAKRRGLVLDVLMDIDVGQERTGVPPERAEELAARLSAMSSLRLRGIQAYAGQVQHISGSGVRREASLTAMNRAASVFRILRRDYGCDIFTGAGTGTWNIDSEIPELTELQLGSYVFMDAEYLGIGWEGGDAPFTPALTLLSTVVSANRKGHVTIDAGLKTLYRDGGVPLVVFPRAEGLRYSWFGDEYGRLETPEHAPRLKPGDRVELVVAHCDPTVNLFDRFHVTRGDTVVDCWEIDLRGRSQ